MKNELDITKQCSCKGHYFLNIWKDKEWDDDWCITISPHRADFFRRLRAVFKPNLSYDDIHLSDKDIKEIAEAILDFQNNK